MSLNSTNYMVEQNDIQFLKDKIDGLNNHAWQVRVNDSTQAHVLSKEAIDLAEQINYPRGKAEGYRTYAFSLIRLSRHAEAKEYAKKSLSLFESLNDLDGQASANGYLGIIERSLGNYTGSLDFLFKFTDLAIQAGNKEAEALSYYHTGATYKYLGDYERALNYLLKGLSAGQAIHSRIAESVSLKLIGQIYFETEDYQNSINYNRHSLELMQNSGDKWGEAGCLDTIGFSYFKLKNLDNALKFCSQALSISKLVDDKKGQGNALYHLGNIYKQFLDFTKAADYCRNSMAIRIEIGDKKGEAETLLFLAGLDIEEKPGDQSSKETFDLLNNALQVAGEIKALDLLASIHWGFYEVCKHFNLYGEALSHIEDYIAMYKKIHRDTINEKIQNLEISHRAEESRKEAEVYRVRNIELADLNNLIGKQKEEVEAQKKISEEALAELKATQSQLIQSEKMASLGELTAGIAHEIQNPLNFVNNFSEVNIELIDELQNELKAGNTEDAIAISNDIKDNEEKINHHGKRADAIVKGMLQHSRTSTGQKELTDINALADEYLHLSYHGIRAKDKEFNSEFKTDFDRDLSSAEGKINIVPQDIGRVLLNLYNNAFYAVNEKRKLNITGYEPNVTVQTKKINGKVEIRISDNGNGIPQNIADKIFQPFFTTKPTGQGTGLGLSLSYDIIKAHGGEIKVETKDGEGTKFIIQLPLF
ncbi:MAG: tetratricopeptide repeat protein [Ginsengibacter sp.]